MIMCCSQFWKLHPRGNGLICVFIPPYNIWDWTWQIIIMKVDYTCIKQGTVYCNVQMTKTKVLHIFQELWKVACYYSCKMKLLPLLVGWVTIHNLWENVQQFSCGQYSIMYQNLLLLCHRYMKKWAILMGYTVLDISKYYNITIPCTRSNLMLPVTQKYSSPFWNNLLCKPVSAVLLTRMKCS